MSTGRRHRGPVENGLENDLVDHREIGPAERSALRVQARCLDLAFAQGELELVTKASSVYLDLRAAAGLSLGGARPPADAFDDVLRALASPSPSDLPDR